MELIGAVMDVLQNRAIVRFQKGCDGECKSCPVGSLFVVKDADICEIEALNRAGASKGDLVRMEIGAQTALSAYALAYGLPLAGLLLGSIIGGVLSSCFKQKDDTLFIALCAFIGLGVSFAISVKRGKNFKSLPVIIEIITDKKAE